MKASFEKCVALLCLALVFGCGPLPRSETSRSHGPGVESSPDDAGDQALARHSAGSAIIDTLRERPSVLMAGSSYSTVAEAVIASDSRVAEAELRVAALRAEAAQRNWLPGIGPRISLNSLSDFVAELVLQQVLFDNGRKRAQRDLAKANVEIAAVAMVEDGNERVYQALSLYLTAAQNRELRSHLEGAFEEMTHFEWVVKTRVEGGLSDRSDLNVIRQILAGMRARAEEAGESVTVSLAELNAVSVRPLDGVSGLGALRTADTGRPLAVLRARAEREKALAEARIARAGHLPGLTANASSDGRASVDVTTDSFFRPGSLAELTAIRATRETADRRVAQAEEDARRQIAAQTRALEAYRRQAHDARDLTSRAKENLDLFQAQFEGGQRQVMDVVGTYEIYAQALETEIELRYKAARAELELARLKGALAEGAQI